MQETKVDRLLSGLTIIIPVKDDDRIFDLLKCLENCEHAQNIQVIVSCNGSTNAFSGKIKSALSKITNSQVIEHPKPGIAAALNRALEKIETSAAFIIDSDCLVDSSFVGKLLEASTKEGSFRVNILYTGGTFFSKLTADWRNNFIEKINNNGSFYTPGIGISMNDFRKIGAFRTDIRHSFDSEFSDRAFKLGLKCRYITDATLVHRCHEEPVKEILIWKSYGMGRFQRMSSGAWPETGIKKYCRALFGDVPGKFAKKSPRHFLYTLAYLCVRASGVGAGSFHHIKHRLSDLRKHSSSSAISMILLPTLLSCRTDFTVRHASIPAGVKLKNSNLLTPVGRTNTVVANKLELVLPLRRSSQNMSASISRRLEIEPLKSNIFYSEPKAENNIVLRIPNYGLHV